MSNENQWIDPESLARTEEALQRSGLMFPSAIGLTGSVQGEGSDQHLVNILTFEIEISEDIGMPFNFALSPAATELLYQRLTEMLPLMRAEVEQLNTMRN